HLAGEPQRLALVHADGQRAEVLCVPLAGRPTADDQLLLGPDPDLQPGIRAAPRLVRRAAKLGEDALEAKLAGRIVERVAVADDVRGEANPVRLAKDAPEQALAVVERDPQ